MKRNRYFPIFIDLNGKEVLIFGAGNIAYRRIKGLLSFGAKVTVIAPDFKDEIKALEGENLVLIKGKYPCEIKPADMILSATNDKEADMEIYAYAKANHIPVNIASDQTKCDFFFPALVENEDIVIGVSSSGADHHLVRKISARLREFLAEIINEYK